MAATRIVVAILAACTALAAAAPQQKPPVFRGGVERVRLEAVVTHRGRPVTGLMPQDFEVRDNGVPIRDVEIVEAPGNLSVAIALDLSNSVVEAGLDELMQASAGLVNALAPEDVAWLITFADELALKVGPVKDPVTVRTALAQNRPGGGTRMWDALISAVSLVQNQRGRSLVLLFTDGQDSNSWLDEDRALETLKRADVVVSAIRPSAVPWYAAPYPYPPNRPPQFSYISPFGLVELEAVAEATGGVVLTAEPEGRLRDQFVALLDEFRLGYVLSFTPTHYEPRKDGWHKVEVKLKNKPGTVRTRTGYFVARR